MRHENGARSRGQKTPFTARQVAVLEELLTAETRPLAVRDLALLRVGIDTMLRASDLLALTVGDVVHNGEVREELILKQRKSGKTVRCALTPKTRQALFNWLVIGDKQELSERVFPVTIRQYSRIVKSFAEMLKLDPKRYSTHSLRRTKPSLIYAKTRNIEVVRRLLGHAGLAATAHYLGVGDTEALDVAREFEV